MSKLTQGSPRLKQAVQIRHALPIRVRLVLSAALFAVPLAPVWAQATEEEAPLQIVQVTGVRDPAILPYKIAYEMLSKIAGASNDRVRLLIKVVSSETGKPIPDLEIILRGDKTFEKVRMSPAGFLTIPLSQEAYDENAEFLSNKKKGALRVQFYLEPKLPAENFSYGDIADGIDAARAALTHIVPWYWRMLMPSLKGIGICYPDNKQSVLISNSAETARPAASEESHNVTEAKVYCANFSAKERGIARDSVISPASGWDPIFR
ncbi:MULTISPECIES: hypothetical protein [unclassified Janthinobacterium]|uniref:hypothetical protein n=1 Tax=unclassified Janthinobacterium TaxID=2610881 RepID=UPI0012FC06F7|nr:MULTISPECIES: hypothetical protein [unclassified Janthinobacterium]MEC5163975.1 hypothetical protein [Janthinobacterium sp. CG_S6]